MSQLLQYYKVLRQGQQTNAKTAPTFEDLTIDDNLTGLQRLVKYAQSQIGLQRLVHAKMISDIASSLNTGAAVAESIVPFLNIFAADEEWAIRQVTAEQIVPVSVFATGLIPDGYSVVLTSVLPILSKLLEDTKPEVRQSACNSIVEVSKLVKPDDLGQYVLTIILHLAHEDDKEDMRMTACQLLNMLAECLGYDLCRQFVIPEIVSLSEDPVFRVRKSAALNFHNICKVGGEHELFERLMPAFVRLSKDDMYRVRRACADSLYEISKYVSNDIRIGVLVEIFLRLTQDPSKLVKQSVLQQSGMFISTLPPQSVNDVILGHYCSMVLDPLGDITMDNELKHYCAYSFPGVLITIGGHRWKDLRDVYHRLLSCRNDNVKQTLAASLHEVAKLIVNHCNIEEELLPFFEDMLQDKEEVQMGVIKHLAQFLGYLSRPCRESYLPVLNDILHSTNPFNWRLRQSFALQLSEFIDLPPKQDVFSMLFELVMTLLQDPVANVRKVSYKGVSRLVQVLIEYVEEMNGPDISPEAYHQANVDLTAMIRSINDLIKANTYQVRQIWCEVTLQLLIDLPREMFERYFIGGILTLTLDTVSNVRVGIAILLTGWEESSEGMVIPQQDIHTLTVTAEDKFVNSPWYWLLKRTDIQECINRLSRDDYDVYNNIIKLKPLFPAITFERISSRGMKIPPGGAAPIHSCQEQQSIANLIPDEEIESIASSASSTSMPPNRPRVGSMRRDSNDSLEATINQLAFDISSSPRHGLKSGTPTSIHSAKSFFGDDEVETPCGPIHSHGSHSSDSPEEVSQELDEYLDKLDMGIDSPVPYSHPHHDSSERLDDDDDDEEEENVVIKATADTDANSIEISVVEESIESVNETQ